MEKIKRDRFEKRSINIAYPEIMGNEYIIKIPDIVLFKRVLEILQNNKFELFAPEKTADILAPTQKKRFRYNYNIERDISDLFPEDDNLTEEEIFLTQPTFQYKLHKSREIQPKRKKSAQ